MRMIMVLCSIICVGMGFFALSQNALAAAAVLFIAGGIWLLLFMYTDGRVNR